MSDKIKPFLKWAGGKRQIIGEIKKLMPGEFNNYFEPFIGGGALFFDLERDNSTINDFNSELINTYECVRDNVDELITLLRHHEDNNSQEFFYELRSWDRDGTLERMTSVQRAARFIYLNKTGFNGLFRVNSAGQFNVPYGRYKRPLIVNEEVLIPTSKFLNESHVNILQGDYEVAVRNAGPDDLVYFDPPYAPLLEDTNNFVGYTLNGFSSKDQERLRDIFVELDNRGCFVMLSNSNSKVIRDLYAAYAETTFIIKANRSVNSKGNGRGKVEEVLVRNF